MQHWDTAITWVVWTRFKIPPSDALGSIFHGIFARWVRVGGLGLEPVWKQRLSSPEHDDGSHKDYNLRIFDTGSKLN